MSKQKHVIKLHGIDKDGNKTKSHNACDVVAFVNVNSKIKVQVIDKYEALLITKKDDYLLVIGNVKNLYQGTCNGVKVHFSKKKIVATLTYWF